MKQQPPLNPESITPGKWTVRDHGNDKFSVYAEGEIVSPKVCLLYPPAVQGAVITDDSGETQVTAIPSSGFMCAEANAKLIAAAPDLLAACLTAVALLERPEDFPGGQPAYGMLRAAVAKAIGGVKNAEKAGIMPEKGTSTGEE